MGMAAGLDLQTAGMKIKNISTFHLRGELKRPFAYSQARLTHRQTTLVAVETEEGVTGWGEAYGPPPPIIATVRDYFAPLLSGRDPRDTEALWDFLFARSLDYGQKGTMAAAISALDIAFWDIKARSLNMPLYRLLGGSETDAIPCYATGFYFGEEDYPREAAAYLEQGFRAMKMKVGRGVDLDAKSVALVRNAIGPNIRLMIDANHAYDPATATALARRVEKHDIYWFEEPVSPLDINGYLAVKRAASIPLAGGEAEYTRFGFEPLLRRRAIDFAQPDLAGCGGITEGMKIATLASIYNIHVTPHAWGSVIGQAAALHFYAARPRHPGTTTPEDKLIECDQTEYPFRTAIAHNPIVLEKGRWRLPEGPGLGVEIDRKAVERWLVA